ncbi:acyltransferase [Sulfurimonas sp. HSL-1656]|uniref:acyltransferase n=1 Tax=Thiomicrolovo subterrani TaxID=3131934 RepID=UPI0031F95132
MSRDISDILKGVSIVVIMLHHMSQTFSPPGLLAPYQSFGYLGVSIFIFLSGYGLSSSYLQKKHLDHFLRKRVFRVYVPFFIVSLFYVILKFMFGSGMDLRDAFLVSSGIRLVSGSYWFVIFIMIAYIFFYFSFKKFEPKNALLSVTLLISLYWITCLLLGLGKWWYTTSFAFPLGILFAIYKDVLIPHIFQRRFMYLTGIIIALGISTVVALAPFPLFPSIGKTFSSTTFVLLIVFISIFANIHSKILKLIGVYAYEIYLSHVVLIVFLRDFNSIEHVAIFLLLVAVTAFGLHKITARIKF